MPAANDQDANSFINGLTGFSQGFRSAALPDEALRRSIDAITDTIACAVLGARRWGARSARAHRTDDARSQVQSWAMHASASS